MIPEHQRRGQHGISLSETVSLYLNEQKSRIDKLTTAPRFVCVCPVYTVYTPLLMLVVAG